MTMTIGDATLWLGDARHKVVSWFSAGVSSAVATKFAIDEHGCKDVIYQVIEEAHPDNERFIAECEQWFGLTIKRIQSPWKSVEAVIKGNRYINGQDGAKCTQLLKMRLRESYEREQFFTRLTYVWGFDCSKRERKRANERVKLLPEYDHIFPLFEKGITKSNAHGILKAAGIKRPVMYDLGFPNNNCIGCVKGGKGYWNLIRQLFPDTFDRMAQLEREIGASCMNGTYLDELDPKAGRDQKVIIPDCGVFCEVTTS